MPSNCFDEISEHLSIRLETRDASGEVVDKGIRRTQLAAAYAGAAHALHSEEAATIAMPTGTGKSAVMILVAALVKAKRVLAVVSSARLREEIAEKFEEVDPLVRLGVLPNDVKRPRVEKVYSRITDNEGWTALEDADVVVGLPQTLSPGYAGVSSPPEDFFDLAVIDEGHHAPAETWLKLIDALGPIPKILFSATPYRLDKRKLPGRIIHTYRMTEALADGVFGSIDYYAVERADGETSDEAICRHALQKMRQDQAEGLSHYFLAKATTKRRAEQLLDVYRKAGARVGIVTSSYKRATNDKAVEKLKGGELDGLICVRMLGEGFDEPSLKIAALHDPDKSLPITLQFIGRFARTNVSKIGSASFFSIPGETHTVEDLELLYRKDSVWSEIVTSHADKAIANEAGQEDMVEQLRTTGSIDFKEPLSERFWEDLRPRQKADVFDCKNRSINVEKLASAFSEAEKIYINETDDISILVTQKQSAPSWLEGDTLLADGHHLFVAYHNREHQLLFLHSSSSNLTTRKDCIKAVAGGSPPKVLFRDLAKVFNSAERLAPFNVGLRTRQYGDGAESYRSSMGRAAGDAFSSFEAVRYVRGHCVAKIEDNQILGMSESSKLWGGQNVAISDFVDWCDNLAEAIRSDTDIDGRRGYFGVPYLEPMNEIPARIVAADWPAEVYGGTMKLALLPESEGSTSDTKEILGGAEDSLQDVLANLMDCEIGVDFRERLSSQMLLKFSWDGGTTAAIFEPAKSEVFRPSGKQPWGGFIPVEQLCVRRGNDSETLIDFLNNFAPTLYSMDGALISGAEGTRPLEELPLTPSPKVVSCYDWPEDVHIKSEQLSESFPENRVSVQDEIAWRLLNDGWDIVFHDDGSGELADLISIREVRDGDQQGNVSIALWHAKYSSGNKAGARVGDVYEVAGQSIKSGRRLTYSTVLAHIGRRHQRRGDGAFLAGTMDQTRDLLSGSTKRDYVYQIKIVQPGTSISKLSPDLNRLIAATEHLIEHGGLNEFEYIGSP